MNLQTKKLAVRAMLVALAMILSWIEAQIPPLMMVPGMKLGFTNIVVLVALYSLSEKDAFVINIVRILLVGFTFGNFYSMSYALAGGLISFLCMFLLKRYTTLNMLAVSVAGAIMHNVGQIFIAMFVMSTTKIFYYLPFLWASGIVAGCFVGILSGLIIKRIPNIEKRK
ncbi:MAG: Gx transporter family protein [Bacillota bacterium]|nr:Gx transporter family protein [Bacillota bacterium]